jgi:hypothetical protein
MKPAPPRPGSKLLSYGRSIARSGLTCQPD